MRRTLAICMLVAVLAVVAVASASSATFSRSGSEKPDVSASFPVLDRNATALDEPSTLAVHSLTRTSPPVELNTVRFVGSTDYADLFIVPTAEGQLCLLVDPFEHYPAISCREASDAAAEGLLVGTQEGINEPVRIAYVLPEGSVLVESQSTRDGLRNGSLFTIEYYPGNVPEAITVRDADRETRIEFPSHRTSPLN